MTPIILHHGLGGFGEVPMDYWNGIDLAIAARGYPVLTAHVHPTAGVRRRARQLKEQILARFGGGRASGGARGRGREKVVILAHSMGGLDARYMITHLGMADRVAALVTLSTPHRGCPYYDWLVRGLDLFGQIKLLAAAGVDLEGMRDVTTAATRAFNREVPDVPGVAYYSVGAVCPLARMPASLWRSQPFVANVHGENDGLVAPVSARWGTYLGTWPIHHYQFMNVPQTVRSLGTQVDVLPRYLELLERVIRKREGRVRGRAAGRGTRKTGRGTRAKPQAAGGRRRGAKKARAGRRRHGAAAR